MSAIIEKIERAGFIVLWLMVLSACGGGASDAGDGTAGSSNVASENAHLQTSEGLESVTPSENGESPQEGLSQSQQVTESQEDVLPDVVVNSVLVSDITTGVSPQELIDNLIGEASNVEISNIVMSGDSRCAGLFSSQDETGAPGFSDGIILGTGQAIDAGGPNTSDETTTEFFTAGDDFLNSLLDNEETFDACVLEFDFVCDGADQVSVEYVMGSEEYNEFVEEGVNDVFGFGLNGNNIATIPNSGGLPVSIGNLNCGDPYDPDSPTTPNTPFCDLFNNNDLQDGGPFFNIEADGFTDVLLAESTLLPGVNHFKFAVGDTIDQAFDTWVFIKSGSFQCNVPDVEEKEITLVSSTRTVTDRNNNEYKNEDIISYDVSTQAFEQYFDGSDVGLEHANVDAFITLASGDILLSLSHDKTLPGIGEVKDEDIIRFNPTSLGVDTAGEFLPFFNAGLNGLVCEKPKDDGGNCNCDCPCKCDGGKKHKSLEQSLKGDDKQADGDCRTQCKFDCNHKKLENADIVSHKDDVEYNSCTHKKAGADTFSLLSEKGKENGSENSWEDQVGGDHCSCQSNSYHKSGSRRNDHGNNSRKKCKAIDIDALDVFEGEITGTDADNDGIPNAEDVCPLDPQNDVDNDGLCANTVVYFSLTKSLTLGGVTYSDEDIIAYDEATQSYSMYLDGSDVGLKRGDIDAIKLLDSGNILISLKSNLTIDGLGEISNEDVIVFEPSSLGEDTAGIFTAVEIDGSEVGLESCKDLNVDGVDKIIISQ